MSEELIKEIKTAINNLKKNIIEKQEELDSLVEEYNKMLGIVEEDKK